MPRITDRLSFNGFEIKAARLSLTDLLAEVEAAVTGFQMLVEERRHANGTRWLRQTIDQQFTDIGGWSKITSGGVDWSKANNQGSKLGVEVQVSGRSDLLAVDVLHLREELNGGRLDVGVIVVPDDTLSRYLTDRTPNLRTAIRHIEDRASDMAIQILAIRHDGVGTAIAKSRTNLGKE